MSTPSASPAAKRPMVPWMIVLGMIILAGICIWNYNRKQPAPETAQASAPITTAPPTPATTPTPPPQVKPMLTAFNYSGDQMSGMYIDCDGQANSPAIEPGTGYKVAFNSPCKVRSSATDEILPVENIRRETVCQVVPIEGIAMTQVILRKNFRKEDCPQP